MIVDDFDIRRAGGRPAKADTELIVHADAVLACTPALQGLEPVTWWRAQEFQGVCRVELRQLTRRDVRDARKSLAFSCLEQRSRVGAAEALDHGEQRITLNVKRQALGNLCQIGHIGKWEGAARAVANQDFA